MDAFSAREPWNILILYCRSLNKLYYMHGLFRMALSSLRSAFLK